MVGLLTFTVSIGAIAIPDNLYEFSALFFLASFGGGLVIPGTYSLVGRMLPRRRGFAVGFVTSAYNLGGLVGPPLVTFVLITYGWNDSFATFFIVGLTSLLLFYAILGGRDEVRSVSKGASLRVLSRNRMILILVLADFVADLAFLAYVSWTPEFVTNRFNLVGSSSEIVGTLFGIGIGLGGVGALLAGTLFDRLGGRKSALLGGLATSLSSLGIYSTNSFPIAAALIVLTGFMSNWFWTLLTSMAQASVAPENRTGAISVVQTAGFLGAVVGPVLTGLLGGATSTAMILTVVLPYIVYAIVVAGMYREAKRPV
jgi:MFS family permease